MRLYTNLAEKSIASQELKCRALQAELELCQANLIEAQEKFIRQTKVKRVSQFELERLPSGGTRRISVAGKLAKCVECTAITACDSSQGCCQVLSGGDTNGIVKTKCHSEKEFRVFEHQTNDDETVFEVCLSKSSPCPSPEKNVNVEAECVVDIAETMCDIWVRVEEVELKLKKAARRKAMQRHTYVKNSVCKAFGCCEVAADSRLFRAACGFVQGSQDQYQPCDDGEFGASLHNFNRQDKNEDAVKATRCMEKGLKELLTQMVTYMYMYQGEVAQDLERKVLRKKRFSTVKLSRVSDMSSSCNPSALGAIASCEGGKGHGEMGLLCSYALWRSISRIKLFPLHRCWSFSLDVSCVWKHMEVP